MVGGGCRICPLAVTANGDGRTTRIRRRSACACCARRSQNSRRRLCAAAASRCICSVAAALLSLPLLLLLPLQLQLSCFQLRLFQPCLFQPCLFQPGFFQLRLFQPSLYFRWERNEQVRVRRMLIEQLRMRYFPGGRAASTLFRRRRWRVGIERMTLAVALFSRRSVALPFFR